MPWTARGEAHPLSSGNFVLYEESADRALRKSAYENLYHTYAASKNTSAALLNGQAKVLKFNSDARKYPSPWMRRWMPPTCPPPCTITSSRRSIRIWTRCTGTCGSAKAAGRGRAALL